MGQKKTVRVFQLIAEDTIEARVLDIRESQRRFVVWFQTLTRRETQGRSGCKGLPYDVA